MCMMVTGYMKILKKIDGGLDCNNEPWAHFSAITNEIDENDNSYVDGEHNNDFYIIKAFGKMANYIERNLCIPRRVLVCGELVIEKSMKDFSISKEVDIESETYTMVFDTKKESVVHVIHNISKCRFLDKIQDKKERGDNYNSEVKVLVKKKDKAEI